MPISITTLPDVLVVKVLQYVHLFDRLCNCSSVSRVFAAHVCEPSSFAVNVVEVSKSRWDRLDPLTQLEPLVWRCSGCSTFSFLAQLQPTTEWGRQFTQLDSVLSFTNSLTPPSCLSAPPPVAYLRYLFLSGGVVEQFASSALKWQRGGSATPLVNVQCVYFSSAAHFRNSSSMQPLAWCVLHLLLSMRSLSILYLGHYQLTSQHFAKLVSLSVHRLDFSSCLCPPSLNTRQWALCSLLESLLLPPFTSWGSGPNSDVFAPSTRRLLHTVVSKTATRMRHLCISGVFQRATLEQLTQLNCLVSLDLTCFHFKDWAVLAGLVGDEEDGQRYRRLRRLRHVRLSVIQTPQSVLPTAAECDTYTQSLRSFLIIYAAQLETVDVMAIPTTLDNSAMAEPWLLPSMPKLKRLEVRGLKLENAAAHRKNWPHRLLVGPGTRLPQLHTLVVSDMEVRDRAVMEVLTAARDLQHVTFESCPCLTPATLLALATYCPSLVSVCLLSCDQLELTGAAFHAAHSTYPTLFLPATAEAQLGPARPMRQCSLQPESVLACLHTFVYELRRAVHDNGAASVDDAGLAILGGLLTHAPLQFFRAWWNKKADWLSFPTVLFPALLTLRSYAVCTDLHEVHEIMQRYVRTRVASCSEGRLAAEQSLVLCDESRYGGRAMSAAELECTLAHWQQQFTHEFQSDESRTAFWAEMVERSRLQQHEANGV